jgi:hypothetical protein
MKLALRLTLFSAIAMFVANGAEAKMVRNWPLMNGQVLRAVSPTDPTNPTDPTEPTPFPKTRDAKMRIVIEKNTFVKNGTNYEWKRDPVCDQTINVGVFDLRGTTDPNPEVWPDSSGCPSMLGTTPVYVTFGGLVTLSKGTVMPGDTPSDFKSVLTFMYLAGYSAPVPETEKSQETLGQTSWTRDINQKSFGMNLVPSVYTMCMSSSEPVPMPQEPAPAALRKSATKSLVDSDCTTNLPEYFSATVEIQD